MGSGSGTLSAVIESGRAPYLVERTLLVSGVFESCLSKLQAHRRLDTPHPAVRYQPPRLALLQKLSERVATDPTQMDLRPMIGYDRTNENQRS